METAVFPVSRAPAPPVSDRDAAPDAFPDPVAITARSVFQVPALYPYQRLVVANILDAAAEQDETPGEPDGAAEPSTSGTATPAFAPDLEGMTALPPEAKEAIERSLKPRSEIEGERQTSDKRDRQLVILPTGAGKSLCFQLPAQLLAGITVVVYPLISLMSDQQRRLDEVGIPAGVLRGGQSRAEREQVFEDARRGSRRIILTNPETLSSPAVSSRLSSFVVSHLVIDEAHCVCEWGETFRPSYLELHRCITAVRPAVVTAFTATASAGILEGIRRHLFPDGCHLIQGNPDRSNIAYHVVPVLSLTHALESLLAPAPRRPESNGSADPRNITALTKKAPHLPEWRYPEPLQRPAIVFCRSRTGAELTASLLRRRLSDNGIRFYHAGLSKPEKQETERWFYESATGILVATCAYGMGVDKKNIRSVVHLDPPPSIESYLQESGRAGRDGNPAQAVLLTPGWTDHDGAAARLSTKATEPATEGSRLPATPGRFDQTDVERHRKLQVERYVAAEGCRRTALLSVMGRHEEACFGCDYCFGFRSCEPAEAGEFLSFLRKNQRRFTRDEASRLACGQYYGEDVVQVRRPPLSGWHREDCDEAIACVEQAGGIHEIKRGPWRGRLAVRSWTTPSNRR
jgi:ATP-dependent DNA helicase RecQ